MILSSLRLWQYRNYESLLLELSDGVTVFLGDNAQGKTNLLEAIALLSTGRSHRTRSDKDMVLWGRQEAALRAQVKHRYAQHDIDVRLYPSARRKVSVNGAEISRTGELLGHLNAVLFAPEDLRLIKEGPQERRRFVDIELSQAEPGYYYALQRYNRVLKQRNALLRSVARQPGLAHMLDVWDEQLCACAPELLVRREAFAARLAALAREMHLDLSSGTEDLSVSYRPGVDVGEEDIAEAMLRQLGGARADDIRRGSTSVGPHRDDFPIKIQNRDSRLFASQGQQRTAALALKLSELLLLQEQTGECPVLLLDDVMSELDVRRRDALITHMKGVQTFITAAVDGTPLGSSAKIYRVAGGALAEG